MKTIIFSLAVMLAFIASPAIAQKANGYNSNSKAGVILKGNADKGTATIDVIYTQPAKYVGLQNEDCNCSILVPWVAKYISPLGFSMRIGIITITTVVNEPTLQKKH